MVGPGRSAARIVVFYAIFATIWILASDLVSRFTTVDADLLTIVAMLKGMLFIAVTSTLLFVLIRSYFARIEEAIGQMQQSQDQLQRSLRSTIDVLGKVVEIRDPYTAGHQERVRLLAVAIAKRMGMAESDIADIGTAAAVHDIGKMSVPAEILTKPGRLSPAEFDLIRVHAQSGYEILSEAEMPVDIAEIVHQHHERCDGSGYPRGLIGRQLLPGAKVLMVADVVEAICSHRPYRAALGLEAARAEIEKGAGILYDQGACRAFIDLYQAESALFPEG